MLIVADGAPETVEAELADVAQATGASLLQLGVNRGKGHAIAAGLRQLVGRTPPVEAVLVVDADGQHPPEAVPWFLAAAADAELVIGDRLGDLGAMPLSRRLANRAASRLLALATRRPVRDSQCGMRLLQGRALHGIAFTGGRYEAETSHLKRCLLAGVAVAWVPIPSLYEGQESSFRPIRDTLRILRAILG